MRNLCKRAHKLTFPMERRKEKGKGKSKGKGKGRYPVRPSHLTLEDRRRRLKELKAKTECRACGRKGHWVNDRGCAMSSSSSSTQNRARTARKTTRLQAAVCFVLNEYSDDPDKSAYMVGQNVALPTEATEHIPLKNTVNFNTRVMNDNDEPWAIEADHRTAWNKTFKSGTYRGMLYGIVLRDFPKQVLTLTKAKSVPTNMREFLSWAQRHYRIDVTASTVESKTSVCWHLLVRVPRWMQRVVSRKGSNAHFASG